jgi:hypothetical protein
MSFQTGVGPRAVEIRDLDLNSSHDLGVATATGISVLRNTSGSAPGCAPPGSNTTGTNSCGPADGSTVSSPFDVSGSGNDPDGAKDISVWLDGSKKLEFRGSDQLQAQLTAPVGSHTLQYVFDGTSGVEACCNYIHINVSGTPPCPYPTSPGINVCSPANGATVDSPITVKASGNSVDRMKLYLDYALAYDVPTNVLNFPLAMLTGSHRLVVQGFTFSTQYNQVLNINIANSPKTCSPSGSAPSVTICNPADGSVVSNPVRVQAAGISNATITSMQVFVDGRGMNVWPADWIDVYLNNLTHSMHRITVEGKDSNGVLFKSSVNVTVH